MVLTKKRLKISVKLPLGKKASKNVSFALDVTGLCIVSESNVHDSLLNIETRCSLLREECYLILMVASFVNNGFSWKELF